MKILIKGAGDLATGVAWELFQTGHEIIMTEIAVPLTVRRQVAYSCAVYEGRAEVEGVTGVLAATAKEGIALAGQGLIGVLVDPEALVRKIWKPDVVIDAIMAKKNLGTTREDAALVLALGPGFTAGKDCDAVIETMRGATLGHPLYEGQAIPNTGVPGMVGGYAIERLIKASADGIMEPVAAIGDIVEKGSILAYTGGQPVYAQLDGIIRGMLQEGVSVKAGMKIGDVDPRKDERLVSLISDKSHRIGQGCIEALDTLVGKRFGIVVLAAGLSKRYGCNKLLEARSEESGKALYEESLDKLSKFSPCYQVVVTRFPEIEEHAEKCGIVTVQNEEPERGISHSLKLGLRACLEARPELSGILFLVCDQPDLQEKTIERILEEGFLYPGTIVCAAHQGKRGNPVLWSRDYFEELLTLQGDVGGRQLIKKYPERIRLVECGEKELRDVDIPGENSFISG